MTSRNIERDPTGFHGDLAQKGRSHTGSASAFPFGQSEGVQPEYGLTKREVFAAMAMQGMVANPEKNGTFEQCANAAIAHADALLTALCNKSDETNHGDTP